MKEEIARRWVQDLRYNPDKQTKHRLYDGGNGYCCLGRLCLLAGKSFEPKYASPGNKFVVSGTEEAVTLPIEVMNWAGMRYPRGTVQDSATGRTIFELSALNDAGASFEVLAKIIEDNWPIL